MVAVRGNKATFAETVTANFEKTITLEPTVQMSKTFALKCPSTVWGFEALSE
jgi:hypothetical protein